MAKPKPDKILRASITLTGPLADYVRDLIDRGIYKSASEYVNDLVRRKLLEEEKRDLK